MTRDQPTAPAPSGAVVSTGRRLFGFFLVAATLFLIFAGAEVKSREAGLSVPDWPKSYGMWMPPMVGNVFYEHGHRMVAAAVGFLTVILALWTWRAEPRAWVRKLAWICLAAVIAQGILGGITVRYLLPTPISMAHGALAQTFLCLLAWIAYASTREWRERTGARDEQGAGAGLAFRSVATAVAAIYVQLLLGAWMRHSEAGLAVPFFPLSETGSAVPEFVDKLVVIHLLHRGFAFVVATLVLRAVVSVWRHMPNLRSHALLLGLLVCGQIVLGAFVIWEAKAPVITSMHVVTGAGILVTSWLLSLRCWRLGAGERSGRGDLSSERVLEGA